MEKDFLVSLCLCHGDGATKRSCLTERQEVRDRERRECGRLG